MPYPMKKYETNAKAQMVQVVSSSVIKILKDHIYDKDTRVDISLDICDDILRKIDKGESK